MLGIVDTQDYGLWCLAAGLLDADTASSAQFRLELRKGRGHWGQIR